MPRLTGTQLIDELSRLGVKIPVMAITGYGSQQLATELKRKGCADYFEKPFDEEAFIKRIGELLENLSRKEPNDTRS